MSAVLDTQPRRFLHYIQPWLWARPVWRLSFSPSPCRHRKKVARYKLFKSLILVETLTSGSQFALAAHDPSGNMVVDGVIITYAIIPAEMIRQAYQEGEPESVMHGGVPGIAHYHHVMVALFRVGSNERITDAIVRATVGEVGLGQKSKDLEPMPIAGQMTYGNYFHMPKDQLYRIHLQIRLPGLGKTVETRFEYQHHS